MINQLEWAKNNDQYASGIKNNEIVLSPLDELSDKEARQYATDQIRFIIKKD